MCLPRIFWVRGEKERVDRFPDLATRVFMASTSTKVFSLQGKSLKLDSRSDIEPHLKDVDPTVIDEIHLGGNTIGVEAAKALAEFLEKTTALKVCDGIYSRFVRDPQG